MASMARKIAGWLWVGAFYALVLAAGVALVGGGAVLATYALGVLRSDASWHLIWGIALMVAGGAVFVGGAVLLFRITNIAVPGRRSADHADARSVEQYGYTDGGVGIDVGHVHHHGGGGHDGGGGN
jgi:hypothetical protein